MIAFVSKKYKNGRELSFEVEGSPENINEKIKQILKKHHAGGKSGRLNVVYLTYNFV